MQKITTFLMFDGQAEEAMNFYVSVFANSSVEKVSRYGENEGGRAHTVRQAEFSLNGQRLMCIDSPVEHDFKFTPAMSLHVTCDSEAEIEEMFAKLAAGGETLMPLGAYPFSRRYGWLSDRFGVSWQLMLVEG